MAKEKPIKVLFMSRIYSWHIKTTLSKFICFTICFTKLYLAIIHFIFLLILLGSEKIITNLVKKHMHFPSPDCKNIPQPECIIG